MTGRKATILVVDDNTALRETLTEVLEADGFVALGVGSREEALGSGQVEIALVDVRLGDADGIELARQLRARDPAPAVILLTGFATLESAQAAVRAGAWAYLVKPCATPELLLTVNQAHRHIVERHELEARARLAEGLAAVGRMAAGLSHEIRNPLDAASLQLTVLERRVQRLPAEIQGPLHGPLGLVQDEIRRLNRILEEFLQLARPQPRTLRDCVELRPLAEQVCELLAAEAEPKGVRLEVGGDDRVDAEGDPDRLRQALVNLVIDAIQATPPGGAVRVALESRPEEVRVVVEDDGPGVPEALRTRIFEPFFTTKPTGSGLGLPMVHAVITQHRGTISVEEGGQGGARFVVRLPRFGGDAALPPAARPSS